MKTIKLLLTTLSLVVISNTYANKKTCNIFIHGYTNNSDNYFGDLPRQVKWNSQKEIEDVAPDVANKILDHYKTCEKNSLMVLRPHSYGAAIVQYILSKGHQFQSIFPQHDFVEVYRNTLEVYAYTGAYHGTPIMDLVCKKRFTRFLGQVIGRKCLKSLSTSKVHNVVHKATTPGVPTHLITSTNRSGYRGIPGFFISRYMVSFWRFLWGTRNQNDNTLPLYATRACQRKRLMTRSSSTCRKVNENYFTNFITTRSQNHSEVTKDEKLMTLTYEK